MNNNLNNDNLNLMNDNFDLGSNKSLKLRDRGLIFYKGWKNPIK